MDLKNLRNLPIPTTVPTFEDVTNGYSILIEYTNGIIEEYCNDNGLEFEGFDDDLSSFIKKHLSGSMEDFRRMYHINHDIANYVKRAFPEVQQLYLGNL